MPEASITTEVHKPFDIHGNFCAKFPFYLEFVIDYLADAVDLSFGEIVCVGIRINLEFVKDPIGSQFFRYRKYRSDRFLSVYV
jgi:hypothetical protein